MIVGNPWRIKTLLILMMSCQAYGLEFEKPKTEAELDTLNRELKDKIPQYQKIQECVIHANLLSDFYQTAKEYWVANEFDHQQIPWISRSKEIQVSFNLKQNFLEIEKSDLAIKEKIKSFAGQFYPKPNDKKDDLLGKLDVIDLGTFELNDYLSQVSRQESQFLFLLEIAKSTMLNISLDYKPQIDRLVSEDCEKAAVREVVAFYQDDTDQVVRTVEKLRDYVYALREKRLLIVHQVIQKIRTALSVRIAEIDAANLSNRASEILAIMRLDLIRTESITWWQRTNHRGLAENRHIKYLAYEKPLRDLHLLSAKVRRFKKLVNREVFASDQLRRKDLSQLERYEKLIQQNIDSLMKKGWQGQLERQVLVSQRRLEIKAKLSAACLRQVELFLDLAPTIASLQDFSFAEEAYAKQVEICTQRGSL